MLRVKFSSPLFWLVMLALCPLTGWDVISAAWAQTPSADQIEMFRNLTPEQQQAVMESMGAGRSGSGSKVRSDRQLDFPQTVLPRRETDRTRLEEEEGRDPTVPREPRFKGDDTILLSLELREFERLPEQEQALKSAQQQELRVGRQPVIQIGRAHV